MARLDLGRVRANLNRVNWKEGLTREGIREQWRRMPSWMYDAMPNDYLFRNAGEVMSYLEHLVRHGLLQDLRDTGEAPQDYKPTIGTQGEHNKEPGVGSGGDPGYTGGGSVQTGVGRSGTTYGDTEEIR